MNATPGMLPQADLEGLVASGDIDTVIVAFCDMQGRLTGKRVSARLFVEDVAAPAAPVDGYLPVAPVTPDPARLAALASTPSPAASMNVTRSRSTISGCPLAASALTMARICAL